MGQTNNMLTQRQSFEVCRWLVEHQKELAGMTQRAAGEAAARALNFGVTEHNIRTALEITGVSLGRERGGRPGKVDRVALVARDLVSLREELGVNVDPRLRGIASHAKASV